jgi:hypothetical protein
MGQVKRKGETYAYNTPSTLSLLPYSTCDIINIMPQMKKSSIIPKVTKTYEELREELLQKHEAKCNKCGFFDQRALKICYSIDFYNKYTTGNGSIRKKMVSGILFYQAALEDTEGNFQLLCANCKEIENYKRLH